MSDKVAVVREFFDLMGTAASEKNPEVIQRVLGMMAPDINYQNKPMRGIKGLPAYMEWFKDFESCTHMKFTVLHMAQDGDWVLSERREEWTVNGVTIEMDLMGKFEVRDGKIQSWIDYCPYIGHWEAANQMGPGFFQRWEDRTSIRKDR